MSEVEWYEQCFWTGCRRQSRYDFILCDVWLISACEEHADAPEGRLRPASGSAS